MHVVWAFRLRVDRQQSRRSSNDLLEYWEDDPETDVVLLYLESFGNPRKFARVAWQGRPLEADPRDAKRHEHRRRTGGLVAHGGAGRLGHGGRRALSQGRRPARTTLQELLDTAVSSPRCRPRGEPRRGRHQRGRSRDPLRRRLRRSWIDASRADDETRAALAEKTPSEASLANPVDLLGSANASTYEHDLPLVLPDPNVDAVIALFVPPVVEDPRAVLAAPEAARRDLDQAAASGRDERRRIRREASNIPESAARALGLAAQRADWLRRPAGTTPELESTKCAPGAIVAASRRRAGSMPTPPTQLLEAYGIPRRPRAPRRNAGRGRRGGRGASGFRPL